MDFGHGICAVCKVGLPPNGGDQKIFDLGDDGQIQVCISCVCQVIKSQNDGEGPFFHLLRKKLGLHIPTPKEIENKKREKEERLKPGKELEEKYPFLTFDTGAGAYPYEQSSEFARHSESGALIEKALIIKGQVPTLEVTKTKGGWKIYIGANHRHHDGRVEQNIYIQKLMDIGIQVVQCSGEPCTVRDEIPLGGYTSNHFYIMA